jgi:hypothetical protein
MTDTKRQPDYIVKEPGEKNAEGKTRWYVLGVAYNNNKIDGSINVFFDGAPVGRRITLFKPEEVKASE